MLGSTELPPTPQELWAAPGEEGDPYADLPGLVDCDDIENCSSFHTCGQIQGGWSWVIAVYGLSFAGFAGYALYITRGLNRAREEEADNDQAR